MSPSIHKGIRKLSEIKSCCEEEDSFENFAPQVNSSFVKDKALYSSLSEGGLEESTNGFNDTSISAITKTSRFASRSPTQRSAQKVAACCRNDFKPIERKTLDETVTSVPASTTRGAFPSSKALANHIREKYNQSRLGTYNVTINNTYSRPEVSPYNVTHYPRTHVPRASRNYNTYENLQPNYLNTQTSAPYQKGEISGSERSQNLSSLYKTNLQPSYFSTPKAKSHRADELFDRSWGNNFSSIQNTTPRSDRRAYGVRPDTFNVTKQPSSSPRYARTIPTVDRLYANPNLTRKVHPVQQNYTYNFTKIPNISPYKQTRAQSEAADRSLTKRLLEESAYTQLADPEMPYTAIERPQLSPTQTVKLRRRLRQQDQSPHSQLASHELADMTVDWPQSVQMQAPNLRRRFQQMNSSYERPHSAEISTGRQQLPACCRPEDGRPRTADPSFVQTYSDVDKLPSCCRRDDEGTKIASSTFKPKGSLDCTDNTCGKRIKPKKMNDLWNEDTYSVIQLVSENTQTNFDQAEVGCQSHVAGVIGDDEDRKDSEEPLDTLLEIRTPHKVSGAASVLPFVLSINISCADRSVVVTPDKGYKSIGS